MNIETTSADFRRAITLASRVIERRNPIPVLEAVRCHANGSFEATGTDLDMAIVATVPRAAGPVMDFVLKSPQSVTHALGAAGGKTVSITCGKDNVSLNSGSLDLIVETHGVDTFPMDMARPLDRLFSATLSGSHLAMIGRVAGAMSTEETRYYLNGIQLRSMGGTTLRASATDGHRLYIADIEVPDANGVLEQPLIIPRKAVGILLELARGATDGIRFQVGSAAIPNSIDSTAPEKPGSRRVGFAVAQRSAEVALYSKLIDGTFPDVDRVIPTGADKQALFKTADLRRGLSAISGHSREVRAAKLDFKKPGEMTLSAAYVGIGLSASVKIPCEHNAAGYVVGFNGGYLTSILSASGGEEVSFDMTSADHPMIVRNPADTAWKGIIMPMRFL